VVKNGHPKAAAARFERPVSLVFIALGSNLQRPTQQLERALQALAALPECTPLGVSRWYHSTAVGPGSQADYINGAAALHWHASAQQLLQALQSIEQHQGRTRTVRWGPRTLDLDILLFGDDIIDTATLTVPHPRLAERNFVLFPLNDLAPQLILPDQRHLKTLLENSNRNGLSLVSTSTSPTIPIAWAPQ
jgi:2-amino-4-hydroxy-6-hydroxymethyldihydropteridine diphosphokinase